MSARGPLTSTFAPRFCASLLLAALLAGVAFAQRGGLNDPRPLQDFSVSYDTAPGTGVLVFTVSAERTSVHLV
jgi:hypothetical protein